MFKGHSTRHCNVSDDAEDVATEDEDRRCGSLSALVCQHSLTAVECMASRPLPVTVHISERLFLKTVMPVGNERRSYSGVIVCMCT